MKKTAVRQGQRTLPFAGDLRWSASGGLPQFHDQEEGGDGGGDGKGDEEEVDEGVHAREWNMGGGTSAGGGQIFLRLKVEFEARVEGFPPADAAKSLRFPHSFL